MANRLHISIRCQLCKNFHHFQFDHQAKFGCCFSYCVHAYVGGPKNVGMLALGALGLGRGCPARNTPMPRATIPDLVALGCFKIINLSIHALSTFWAQVGCPKNFGDAWVPPTSDGDVADPRNMLLSHLCYFAKFGHSESNLRAFIMDICLKILTPHPGFQGHRKQHGLISHR